MYYLILWPSWSLWLDKKLGRILKSSPYYPSELANDNSWKILISDMDGRFVVTILKKLFRYSCPALKLKLELYFILKSGWNSGKRDKLKIIVWVQLKQAGKLTTYEPDFIKQKINLAAIFAFAHEDECVIHLYCYKWLHCDQKHIIYY